MNSKNKKIKHCISFFTCPTFLLLLIQVKPYMKILRLLPCLIILITTLILKRTCFVNWHNRFYLRLPYPNIIFYNLISSNRIHKALVCFQSVTILSIIFHLYFTFLKLSFTLLFRFLNLIFTAHYNPHNILHHQEYQPTQCLNDNNHPQNISFALPQNNFILQTQHPFLSSFCQHILKKKKQLKHNKQH